MARAFFKLPSYKRFNYTPRYNKGKEKGQNIYDFDSAIRRDRESYNYNAYGSHWNEARSASRNRGNRLINNRLLIIVGILVLVFLYIIDFDLTIFNK